jgi:predicted acetyltransferase
MTGKKFVLSVAAICCVLCLPVYSQKLTDSGIQKPGTQLELVEAEAALKMHELELKMCEFEVKDAMVESDKLKLHLEEAVQEQASKREIAHAKLTLKQAGIRVEMKKLESEMIRLRIKVATVRLELARAAMKGRPGANR